VSHILIVDDDPQVRRTLCRILETHDLKCQAVSTVSEARSVIAGHIPAIVLLDVVVGNESGLNFHAELRRGPQTSAVVFITGRRDLFPQLVAVAGPLDDWIIKPWDPEELVARVRLVLRRLANLNPASAEAR
jgi:two-component system OmpR family response regulator